MQPASEPNPPINASDLAGYVARQLESRSREYALGGAIALGFWGVPRGTVDVDLTLFLPPDQPSECIWLLQEIGCEMSTAKAAESLREHGFCSVTLSGMRLDVFLPMIPFYQVALARRKHLNLDGQPIMVWDAESLTVFKMMFFRRKDLADVEQILRTQGDQLDRRWVREQLIAIYGERDPRISEWDGLMCDVP
jgi:hypothetical protein